MATSPYNNLRQYSAAVVAAPAAYFLDFGYGPRVARQLMINCPPNTVFPLQFSLENDDAVTVPTNWMTLHGDWPPFTANFIERQGVWLRGSGGASNYEIIVILE